MTNPSPPVSCCPKSRAMATGLGSLTPRATASHLASSVIFFTASAAASHCAAVWDRRHRERKLASTAAFSIAACVLMRHSVAVTCDFQRVAPGRSIWRTTPYSDVWHYSRICLGVEWCGQNWVMLLKNLRPLASSTCSDRSARSQF